MAAVDEYIAVFDAAEQGWRDALAAIPKMPVVLGVAVLVVLALGVLPLGPDTITNPNPDQLFWFHVHSDIAKILFLIAHSFFLTPVAIAIHRFVLLDEVAQRYEIGFSLRFMRFFLFSLMFQILIVVPGWLGRIAAWLLDFENGIAASIIFFPTLLVAVSASVLVAAVAALRVLILFPAVAVDVPGAGWRNAMTDSKAHTLRIFFVVLVTAIPIFGLRSSLLDFQSDAGPHLRSLADKIWCFVLNEKTLCSAPNVVGSWTLAIADWAFNIAYAVIEVFALCAFAAVASRLFAAFANKLNG